MKALRLKAKLTVAKAAALAAEAELLEAEERASMDDAVSLRSMPSMPGAGGHEDAASTARSTTTVGPNPLGVIDGGDGPLILDENNAWVPPEANLPPSANAARLPGTLAKSPSGRSTPRSAKSAGARLETYGPVRARAAPREL